MPAEPLDLPRPRPSYSICMLLHNVRRILAPTTARSSLIATANAGPAVRAARNLLLAFGIEPDIGEP